MIREYFNFFVQYLGRLKNVLLARAGEVNSSAAKGKVTLFYGAKDPHINQAVVLTEYLKDMPT